MKKYEIYKDTFETKRNGKVWSTNDMINTYDYEDSNAQLIASFDNLEEAKKCFESEKATCSSKYQDGSIYELLIFDYPELQENEYDEDNEFQNSEVLDCFVNTIEHSVDELKSVVEDSIDSDRKITAGESRSPAFVADYINKLIYKNYRYLIADDRKALVSDILIDKLFDELFDPVYDYVSQLSCNSEQRESEINKYIDENYDFLDKYGKEFLCSQVLMKF